MKLIIVVVRYRAFGEKEGLRYLLYIGYQCKHEPPSHETPFVFVCGSIRSVPMNFQKISRTYGAYILSKHHRRLTFALKTENVFYFLSVQPSPSFHDFTVVYVKRSRMCTSHDSLKKPATYAKRRNVAGETHS